MDSVSGATITSAAVKAAIEDAAGQAGADVDRLKKAEVPSKAEDGEYEYDVVVAGAGLSGLMAAYEAASQGVKVALIEKTGIIGGTSITASGIFACAESGEYIEPMYQAWLKKNENHKNNQVEEEMVRALCEASPEVLDLIKKAGVEYEISTSESNQSQTFFSKANQASTTQERGEENRGRCHNPAVPGAFSLPYCGWGIAFSDRIHKFEKSYGCTAPESGFRGEAKNGNQ